MLKFLKNNDLKTLNGRVNLLGPGRTIYSTHSMRKLRSYFVVVENTRNEETVVHVLRRNH